ncbi:MAG TPA: hypothetical protein VI112_01430 [Bacteroidia bacterium]|jgi:hypothetical protein
MKITVTILSVAIASCFALSAQAQGKIGNLLHGVKDNVQTVKSTVDLVKPEDNKEQKNEQTNNQDTQTNSQQQDTSKKTTKPTGTTNNIAIGDEGSNNNDKNGNGNNNGKKNQVKDFMKDNKENGSKEKPYTGNGNGTTPTSNLAIGDEGSTEDKKNDNGTNKQNTVNPK